MDLVFKRFKLLLLIFAALVFNAHMIIPHDHHALDYDVCQGKSTNSGNHNNFPFHCHAFNDLASEKAVNFVISHAQITDLLPGCLTDNSIPKVYLSSIEISDVSKTPVNPCISEYSLLRAPPAF